LSRWCVLNYPHQPHQFLRKKSGIIRPGVADVGVAFPNHQAPELLARRIDAVALKGLDSDGSRSDRVDATAMLEFFSELNATVIGCLAGVRAFS
jgi:hypothetical protein